MQHGSGYLPLVPRILIIIGEQGSQCSSSTTQIPFLNNNALMPEFRKGADASITLISNNRDSEQNRSGKKKEGGSCLVAASQWTRLHSRQASLFSRSFYLPLGLLDCPGAFAGFPAGNVPGEQHCWCTDGTPATTVSI